MRRSPIQAILLGLTAAVFCVPSSASGQVHFIVGGGLSKPSSNLSDLVDSGYHGRLGIQAGFPLFPLAFRVEGDANRFPATNSSSGHATIVAGTASAVLSLGGVGISPYVVGGLGKYRTSFSSELGLGGATTDTGYHLGVGISAGILGFGGFVEARWVNISASGGNLRYFPITVGLRF